MTRLYTALHEYKRRGGNLEHPAYVVALKAYEKYNTGYWAGLRFMFEGTCNTITTELNGYISNLSAAINNTGSNGDSLLVPDGQKPPEPTDWAGLLKWTVVGVVAVAGAVTLAPILKEVAVAVGMGRKAKG